MRYHIILSNTLPELVDAVNDAIEHHSAMPLGGPFARTNFGYGQAVLVDELPAADEPNFESELP